MPTMTDIKVVIGSSHGDEGKGLITDYLAHNATLINKSCVVVLSNGGSQRGHTVCTFHGIRHVFRHFGSGTFVGALTYIPKEYIVNPMNFVLECRSLGYAPTGVYMHPDCLISTPYDMISNQIIEESRGDKRHGSCGVGIWETILRDGLTFNEMMSLYYKSDDHKDVKDYLRMIRDTYFRRRLSVKGIIDKEWRKIINSEMLIENYIKDLEFMSKHVIYSYAIPKCDTIIFENGQGLLLDQNIEGYDKNTTPSNTGLQNPSKYIKDITGHKNVEVIYVSRTYLTRHGEGRFDTETKSLSGINQDKTNVWNQFQGHLRYGVLIEDDLIKRCVEDFKKYSEPNWKMSFAITHLDEYSKFNKTKFDDFGLYLSTGETRFDVTKCKR